MFSAGGGVGLVITVGKDVGVGVYVGLLVEESPDGPCARPIIRLPTCIQRGRRLAVCLAYRLPAGFAFGDKGRKIGPTARNGYGLLVSSPVSLGHHAAGPARQTGAKFDQPNAGRSEEHTSELQSLMRNSYAVFCLKKKTNKHA